MMSRTRVGSRNGWEMINFCIYQELVTGLPNRSDEGCGRNRHASKMTQIFYLSNCKKSSIDRDINSP